MSLKHQIHRFSSLYRLSGNVISLNGIVSGIKKNQAIIPARMYSCCSPDDLMDIHKYENLSEETLELLSQKFEEIIESRNDLADSDIELGNGVLTVKLATNGTFVINKQTPNRQIWLSSPISGPKRYDWIDGNWIYKRDKVPLQKLLSQELSQLTGSNVDFGDLDLTKFT